MSNTELPRVESTDHWPSFSLRYTFNPDEIDGHEFNPDELVVVDSTQGVGTDAWISAARDSYVAIEETR